jgi:hypothetical protein
MRKDDNQGEGDRLSARRYDQHAERFVRDGKVEDAARNARDSVDRDPSAAARAEQAGKRGPGSRHRSTADELVAKGRTLFDHLRPALARLRARFTRR